MTRRMLAVPLLAALALLTPATADAAPCAAHKGAAKRACHVQGKRDHLHWPPRPSDGEIRRRVGASVWRKALRVAQCETGGNWQHFVHGNFIGGLGMYRNTYAYGQRATGYRWPAEGATRAEQIAIAVASWPITRGWNGWGCRGA